MKNLRIRNTLNASPTELVAFLKEDAQYHVEPMGEFSLSMPDVRGMVLKDVLPALENLGKQVSVKGFGYITRQEPEPGTPFDSIQRVVLELHINEIISRADTTNQGI